MTEYRTGNALVRIHGSVEREKIKESTIRFIKGVMKCQKQKARERQRLEISS